MYIAVYMQNDMLCCFLYVVWYILLLIIGRLHVLHFIAGRMTCSVVYYTWNYTKQFIIGSTMYSAFCLFHDMLLYVCL